jgi:hypothetical protein
MLELRLRCGKVVSFDGRVLEVFDGEDGSRRFHVTGLSAPRLLERPEGATIVLDDPPLELPVTRAETPASARLVAAIEQARAVDCDPLGSP